MGVGVTMTRAAQVLFVDESWTPAENAGSRPGAPDRTGAERERGPHDRAPCCGRESERGPGREDRAERDLGRGARVDETFVAPALALPDLTPPTVVLTAPEVEGETPIDF